MVEFNDLETLKKQEPKFIVWRIENLEPQPLPQDVQPYQLHVGDSYIFLKTRQQKKSGSLQWNIHFWIGKNTSVDEAGAAAIKAVELDDALDGLPVQYRECQGFESDLFMSYFKETGLTYLEGGIESGFKHVEKEEYTPRLFELKGKKNVRVSEVPAETASLTKSDVFVLDMGSQIFLYNGEKANVHEKAKGIQFISQLKNDAERAEATVTILDDDPKNETFWSTLGGYTEVTNEGTPDEEFESIRRKAVHLLKLSDAAANAHASDVTPSNGILTKDLLDSSSVFIIDNGKIVYTWVGKEASQNERKEAIRSGIKYLAKNGRSFHTPIARVVDGAEPAEFKALFTSWNPPQKMTFGYVPPAETSSTQQEANLSALFSAPNREKVGFQSKMDENVSHELKIWRIVDMEKEKVPEEMYGQFYGGDSYIILDTMTDETNKQKQILYFWQGTDSSIDEKATSAILTVDMDDSLGGSPIQVRVTQGKEPSHFRRLFNGKLIVRSGGKASGFRNSTDEDSMDTDGVHLFHIKGTESLDAMASQVPEESSNLNSGDCFVLVTPEKVYIWHGSGASEEEKKVAESVSEVLSKGKEVESIEEGSEDDQFWSYLGGKAEYPSEKEGFICPAEPRLFRCTSSLGYFNVEEIYDFSQQDLLVDDVFILDTYTTVFVWVGSKSSEYEKKETFNAANEYLKSSGSGDRVGTPIVNVHCGEEPAIFTCNFLAWDDDYFEKNDFVDPYEVRLEEMRKKKEAEKPEDPEGTITMDDVKEKMEASNEDESEAVEASENTASEEVEARDEGASEAPVESSPANDEDVKKGPVISPRSSAAFKSPSFANASASISKTETATAENYHYTIEPTTKFSYDELVAGVDGIDITRKEAYLSDSDFKDVFKITRVEFNDLPKWKKQMRKREVKLF